MLFLLGPLGLSHLLSFQGLEFYSWGCPIDSPVSAALSDCDLAPAVLQALSGFYGMDSLQGLCPLKSSEGSLVPMTQLMFSVCQQRMCHRHAIDYCLLPLEGSYCAFTTLRPATYLGKLRVCPRCREWSLPCEMEPARPFNVPGVPDAPDVPLFTGPCTLRL